MLVRHQMANRGDVATITKTIRVFADSMTEGMKPVSGNISGNISLES